MKHRLQAIREFAARYGAVLRAAWSARASLDPPARSRDELDFLPAHLELTDTPVSPAARWAARLIMAFFAVALLWSVLGHLDIVAVAPGKTVVGARTKLIQPADTAVVRRILVRDGQHVAKGQLLIELDAAGTTADVRKAGEAWTNARLADLRLSALARALDEGAPPRLDAAADVPADRHAEAQRLASSQFEAYRAKREELRAQIAQREAEIGTAQALIGPLAESAGIATQRAEDYARLVKQQYVGRHDYLQREQERIAAQRDLATQRNRLVESRTALASTREQLAVLDADMRHDTLDQLAQARDQALQLHQDVDKARQRDRFMRLRSPVDGTVQQLAVHTVGGVVTPAEALLAVVPEDGSLEVEATVLNKDIGFIRPGQRATVKVESFPYTRYGYLEGVVDSVSHDAAQDDKLGLVYPARVRLADPTLRVDGALVRLTPGMNLSVEIQTGQRRVISYLLSPLQTHVGEAMRER